MTQFKNLKEGQKLSETQYYSVVKIKEGKAQLQTDSGEMIVVDSGYVEKCLTSAHEFTTEKTVSKTEAAQVFVANPNVTLSVNFNTKVDAKEAKDAIEALYPNKGGKILSEADFKKKVSAIMKDVTVGKERTMVGRHFGELNDLGRVNFIDMEVAKDPSKTYDNRQRQVDPRTINWMIIRGVKYTVK